MIENIMELLSEECEVHLRDRFISPCLVKGALVKLDKSSSIDTSRAIPRERRET